MNGHLMPDKPCDICQTVEPTNYLEPRFLYVTCIRHEHVPPVMREDYRRRHYGDPYKEYTQAFPPLKG